MPNDNNNDDDDDGNNETKLISAMGNTKPKRRRPTKKNKRNQKLDEEERRLTSLIFGETTTTSPSAETVPAPSSNNEPLLEIDRVGDRSEPSELRSEPFQTNDESKRNEEDEEAEIVPAWIDDDDAALPSVDLTSMNRLKRLRHTADETFLKGKTYERRLRERFEDSASTRSNHWAALPSSSTDDMTSSNILSSAEPLLSSQNATLAPNVLDVERCRNANQSDSSELPLASVMFHPVVEEKPLCMTAGFDKTLRMFQIDGDANRKVQGVHFPDLSIRCASFLGTTGSILVSGRRPYFYFYDPVAGKMDRVSGVFNRSDRSLETHVASPDGKLVAFCVNDGYVLLLDTKTKAHVGNFKLNGHVRTAVFTPDGDGLIASGTDGDVYRFDLRSRRCLHRYPNQDGTYTSAMALSSRYLAIGADSGVVNLYPSSQQQQPSPSSQGQPLKSLFHLQTTISTLRFNHDSQLMAFASDRNKNALKVLHVESKTVFSNWPTSKTPLQKVRSCDFSRDGRYFAVGNDKGKCLLYKLKHYWDDGGGGV